MVSRLRDGSWGKRPGSRCFHRRRQQVRSAHKQVSLRLGSGELGAFRDQPGPRPLKEVAGGFSTSSISRPTQPLVGAAAEALRWARRRFRAAEPAGGAIEFHQPLAKPDRRPCQPDRRPCPGGCYQRPPRPLGPPHARVWARARSITAGAGVACTTEGTGSRRPAAAATAARPPTQDRRASAPLHRQPRHRRGAAPRRPHPPGHPRAAPSRCRPRSRSP